jgi:hypothetical protein
VLGKIADGENAGSALGCCFYTTHSHATDFYGSSDANTANLRDLFRAVFELAWETEASLYAGILRMM